MKVKFACDFFPALFEIQGAASICARSHRRLPNIDQAAPAQVCESVENWKIVGFAIRR